MAAEAIISKEENMFRVEWIPSSSTMLVQMLSKDDLTLDDPATAEQKWLYYMSSYSLWQPTEGLPGEAAAPFLARSIAPNSEAEMEGPDAKFTVKTGLEIKICIRTYRLFFVAGTEDVFARHRRKEQLAKFEKKAEARRKHRSRTFRNWLEEKVNAGSGGSAEEAAAPPVAAAEGAAEASAEKLSSAAQNGEAAEQAGEKQEDKAAAVAAPAEGAAAAPAAPEEQR